MKKLMITFRDVVCILLLVIFAQFVSQLLLGLPQIVIPSIKNNHICVLISLILVSLFYLLIFYCGFIWLNKHFYHNNFSSTFRRLRLKDGIQYFGYAILMVMIMLCGSFIIGLHLVLPSLNYWNFMKNLFSEGLMFFVPPLVEEIAFRVVIIEQVARQYNLVTGVIVSSILFGVVHLMNGQLNFVSAIQLVLSGSLMGCLLSLSYLYSGSIWSNYIIHAFYNLFFTIVPVQNSITHDWPFQFIFISHNQLITGGQYGSDCSLSFNIAYLIMIALFFNLLRNKKSSVIN